MRFCSSQLLCALLCFSAYPAAARPHRVLSWNIQYAKRGLKPVLEQLQRARANIIALQEVDKADPRSKRVDQPRHLARALGYKVRFCPHRYRSGRTGVALLTPHTIERTRCLRAKGSRLSFLVADLKVGGKGLRVLSLHLHPTHPFASSAHRKHFDQVRLREARAAYRAATTGRRPALVLGDFNDDTGSAPYTLFARSFIDGCRAAGGFYEKTWPAAFPLTRIDYLWASRQLRVLSCSALATSASDHRPILGIVRLLR